jgi:hypothetical protein
MIQPTRFRYLIYAQILTALLVTAGCRGQHGRTAVQNDEGPPVTTAAIASSLRVSDPGAPAQLVKGFSTLEAGSWRWTAGHFSVLLKTPPGAAEKGGTLSFALVVSDAVLKQVQSQTLTASIGGADLKSEKYTTAGSHTFSADIPASALTGENVTIDFSVDKSLPSSPADRRELAVIATAIGLESK